MSEMYSTTFATAPAAASTSAGQNYHNHQQTTNQRPNNINNQTLPSTSGLQNNNNNTNNTFLHSIVQDYLLSPVLSHLTTTASIFGQQSEFHQPQSESPLPPTPPTSPGSYPPSGSDKLYEILYRSSRKLFGAPSMAYDCAHHSGPSSVRKSFEEASQLLAGLALDHGSNLCPHPSQQTRVDHSDSTNQESNMLNKLLFFFMPAFGAAEQSSGAATANSRTKSPTMDGSNNFIRSSSVPNTKSGSHSTSSIPASISAATVSTDALASFPSLLRQMKQCPRASQMLDAEVTGPAHHMMSEVFKGQLLGHLNMLKRSECKRSRSMSEVDLIPIVNEQNRSMVTSESPQMTRDGMNFRLSSNPVHSNVDSAGEDSHSEDDDDDFQQSCPLVAESPTKQHHLDFQRRDADVSNNCQPLDCEPSIVTLNKEPEVQECKVLQEDRQRRKEKKNKNRRRRTRKAKNKSSSDESDFSKSSECGDSSRDESSDELPHYQLSASPKIKKSSAHKGRGKKRVKSANNQEFFTGAEDDDDDGYLVFSIEDHQPKSPKSPKSPKFNVSHDEDEDSYADEEDDDEDGSKSGCTGDGRRLSELFAPALMMTSLLRNCSTSSAGASTSRNLQPTTSTSTACDTISSHDDGQNQKPKCSIQSSMKSLFQTIQQVQCPFTRGGGLIVTTTVASSHSNEPSVSTATPNNTPVSQVIAIPDAVYDDDEDYRHPLLNIGSASPDPSYMLTEDDIRRNQEMAVEEERIRLMVADANRRWDEAMNQELEQTVPQKSAAAAVEEEEHIFDLDEDDDEVDSATASCSSPSIIKAKQSAKKSKDRTIHFSSDPPQVFLIDLTEEEAAASREVRSKFWENFALDRQRQARTNSDLLSAVLAPEHRARIYRERFQDQQEDQQQQNQQQQQEPTTTEVQNNVVQ